MFCAGCGKELREDAVFCDRCGRPVKDTSGRQPVLDWDSQERKKEKTQKILIFALLGVAVVIAVIALVMALGRGKSDESAELLPSESAAEEPGSEENEKALAAYEQFLKNEKSLILGEIVDTTAIREDNRLCQELPAREYYLSDLLQQIQELNGEKFDRIDWAYLDCGDDGVKELALNLAQLDTDSFQTCIICYEDGDLKLCYDYVSGYRTYAQLCRYGYLIYGGASGAAVHGEDARVIDKKGERKDIYGWTEYYGVNSLWYLGDQAGEVSQWANSQGLEDKILVDEYTIGADRYYLFYIFREERGEYELANAREGEFFGDAAAEEFFQRCSQASEDFRNHGGVTQEEIDELIQERQRELGLSQRQLDQTEVEWTLLEDPIYDVYRKEGAASGDESGASTEPRDSAPADMSGDGAVLNQRDISDMVRTLAWFEGPMRVTWKDSGKVCANFLMFTEGDHSRILEHYPDAYMDDYWLCMPEETVRDYLRNSIGMENLVRLEAVALLDNGYCSYHNGVYRFVHPDTGDYWIEDPHMDSVERISHTELEVKGQIRHGVLEDDSTTFFTLRLTENPQSVWSGYTLSRVERWDTYILPYVDTEYLIRDEVAGWSKEHLRLARNEIYARHGRIFEDELLKNYFNSCDWYEGTVPADSFDESVFGEIEEENRQFLIAYEEGMGYR